MAQGEGNNARLLRILETTWGTTPSITPGDMVALPVSTCGFSFRQPRREVRHGGLANWNPTKPVRDRSQTGGPVSFMLNGTSHGFLLADIAAPVDAGGGPYTHTYKLGTPPVGASFEVGDTVEDLYDVFRGMRLVNARFRAADAGPIECEFTYRGQDQADGGSSLDSAPTSYADEPFDMGIALGAAVLAVKVGGSPVANLLDIEWTIERPAGQPSFAMGGEGIPANMPLRKGPVRGTATFQFDSWTNFDAAKAGTETSFDILCGVGDGGGTAGNEQVQLVLPEVVWEPLSPQMLTDDGVVQGVPFWSYYHDGGDATAFKAILTNAIATIA